MKTIFFAVSALALFVMTACKDPSDGTGTLPEAPFVEGGVSFILSPDKRTITVKVKTAVGNVTVEGCEETTLTSDTEAELHAQGTRVTLKGDITELKCDNNQLISLNVQGLTALESLECFNNRLTALNVQDLPALQELECRNNELTSLNLRGMTALQGLRCGGNKLTALNVRDLRALQTLRCNDNLFTELDVHGLTALQNLSCKNNKLVALNVQGCTALRGVDCLSNKLDAQAFTKLFSDLPQSIIYAYCYLYTEEKGVLEEGNCKDFTNPPELKAAFEKAKTEKNWTMYKINTDGKMVAI